MSVLVLQLAGPMQSWGSSSRFARRATEIAPTKSGVIGLLAAAKGIRRTEPITDLLGLEFGVRVDQPGEIMRDFQTAHLNDGRSAPLTHRYYLADAKFLAAVEGDQELLTGLDECLRRPQFPVYLGRRSCPPSHKVSLGVHDGPLDHVLDTWPWLASEWFRKRRRTEARVRLEILRDARPDDAITETFQDAPISFDPARREYGWRLVVRRHTDVDNDQAVRTGAGPHDPMSLLGA